MRIILSLIVYLLTTPLLAQQPAPSSGGQQPQQYQQQQPAYSERGTDDKPFIVKQIPHDPSDYQRQQDNDKSGNDAELVKYTTKLAKYTWELFIATCAVAAVTAGLWFFTGLMWWTTRQALSDGEKAVKAAVASAKEMANLAKSAAEHAGHADRAIGVSEETARKQLRAYVFIDDAKFEINPTGGNDWYVHIMIKNFGQTPAYNVRIKTQLEITGVVKDETTIFPFTDTARLHPEITIAPQHLQTVRMYCPEIGRGLGAWTIAGQSGYRAFLWGRIDYMALGRPAFLTFQMACYFGQVSNFAACESGNDADQEGTDQPTAEGENRPHRAAPLA